jgi:translation initiation factor 1
MRCTFLFVTLQLSNAHNRYPFSPAVLHFVSPVAKFQSRNDPISVCHLSSKRVTMDARGEELSYSQDVSLRLAQSLNSWKSERFFDSGSRQDNAGSLQSRVTKKAATEKPKKIDVFSSKIRLQSTRAGKGGKTVTILKGLEHLSKEDAQSILRSIKQKISVGGKIGENGVLEIQGDQVSFLLEYLSGSGYRDVKRG